MNYFEKVQKFKDIIPIGVKQVSELVKLLNTHIDIKAVPLQDLPDHVVELHLFNATHCTLNETLKICPDEMSLKAYQVIKNERSIFYYDSISQSEEYVNIFFEERTGYISSNSNRLFLTMELARGISQYEYENEGNQFRSLIFHLTNSISEKISYRLLRKT